MPGNAGVGQDSMGHVAQGDLNAVITNKFRYSFPPSVPFRFKICRIVNLLDPICAGIEAEPNFRTSTNNSLFRLSATIRFRTSRPLSGPVIFLA